jgi:hypothetical protein
MEQVVGFGVLRGLSLLSIILQDEHAGLHGSSRNIERCHGTEMLRIRHFAAE